MASKMNKVGVKLYEEGSLIEQMGTLESAKMWNKDFLASRMNWDVIKLYYRN